MSEKIAPAAPETEPVDESKIAPENREYVEKLRKENAKYRTERNTFKSELDDVKKKADEYDVLLKKQAEEQGNFKKLYEEANGKIELLTKAEARLKTLEAGLFDQFEAVKKGMTEKQIELLNKLPDVMPVEARIEWARELIGQKGSVTNSLRPGVGEGTAPEAVLKEFETANLTRRGEIILAAKQNNPDLYRILTKQ